MYYKQNSRVLNSGLQVWDYPESMKAWHIRAITFHVYVSKGVYCNIIIILSYK